MVHTAATRVIEWEDASRRTVKSETLSFRTVYVREPDRIRNEHLSVTIDGRKLSRKEIERELAKQQRLCLPRGLSTRVRRHGPRGAAPGIGGVLHEHPLR